MVGLGIIILIYAILWLITYYHKNAPSSENTIYGASLKTIIDAQDILLNIEKKLHDDMTTKIKLDVDNKDLIVYQNTYKKNINKINDSLTMNNTNIEQLRQTVDLLEEHNKSFKEKHYIAL